MKTSVIIPLYNKATSIIRSIESVFEQTLQPTEIIIIDDKSTDNSYNVISNYVNERKDNNSSISLRLFKNESNYGPGKTRNYGIDVCEGDVVFFLDGDDIYTPDYIRSVIELMSVSEDIKVVISRISEDGGAIVRPNFSQLISKEVLIDINGIITTTDFVNVFCSDPIFCSGNVAVAKDILNHIRFNEHENNYEDWFFFYEICTKVQNEKLLIAFLTDYIGVIYSSDDHNSLSRKKLIDANVYPPAFIDNQAVDMRFRKYVYYNWLYSNIKRIGSVKMRNLLIQKEFSRIRSFSAPVWKFLFPSVLFLINLDVAVDFIARARKFIKYA